MNEPPTSPDPGPSPHGLPLGIDRGAHVVLTTLGDPTVRTTLVGVEVAARG